MCVYTYANTYMHIYIYVHTCVYIYICLHLHTHIYIYIYMYTCIYTCAYKRIYTYIDTLIHIRTYVHIYTVYIYIHTLKCWHPIWNLLWISEFPIYADILSDILAFSPWLRVPRPTASARRWSGKRLQNKLERGTMFQGKTHYFYGHFICYITNYQRGTPFVSI